MMDRSYARGWLLKTANVGPADGKPSCYNANRKMFADWPQVEDGHVGAGRLRWLSWMLLA
jgi:hypothetical protein